MTLSTVAVRKREGHLTRPPLRNREQVKSNVTNALILYVQLCCVNLCNIVLHYSVLICIGSGRGGASPLSPTRESVAIGDEEEEEEEDEFGGQETLVTHRRGDTEFSQQDTLVIREDQPGINVSMIQLLNTHSV